MTRRYSAPGKLVLIGEYAVVDGARAVVAAVDRRAVCTIEPAASELLRVRGNDPRWTVVTSALLDEGDGGLEARDANAGGERPPSLLLCVLRELVKWGIFIGHSDVTVSTTSFSSDAGKLGLGSSAAAAVALAFAWANKLGVDAVHDIARAAHRAFQGGGSGIDVAASAYGGLTQFSLEGSSASVAPAPPIPAALDVVVAYTGKSAQTQGFVDAYRALPDRVHHKDAIAAAVADFEEGCAKDDAAAVLRAVDRARVAMQLLGVAAGKDVVTRELHAIADLARAHGGSGKPSGAGGGDVSVCFVPRDERPALEAALAAAGFPVVRLEIGAPGARIDDGA